jgi:hypothetical protein
MIIKTSKIEWDTDGATPDLPQEVTIEVGSEEDIADALSDKYGWCLKALDYEICELFELISKDAGVSIGFVWSEDGCEIDAITINGCGGCEFGEVMSSVLVEDNVKVRAKRVNGSVTLKGDSMLVAGKVTSSVAGCGSSEMYVQEVGGSVTGYDRSKLEVGMVLGDAFGMGSSVLELGTVEGDAGAFESSRLSAETVDGARKCSARSVMVVGEEAILVEEESEGVKL